MAVVGVHIERPPVEFYYRAHLVSLDRCGTRQNPDRRALRVKYAARWDVAAGGELRISRPVSSDLVTCIDRWHPRAIIGRMKHAWRAAQAAHRLAVVGELSQIHSVLGDLHAGCHAEIVSDPVFILDERLRRLRIEVLMEVG